MPTYRIVISETADKKRREVQAYDADGSEACGITQGFSPDELFDVYDQQVEATTPYKACVAGLNEYQRGGR